MDDQRLRKFGITSRFWVITMALCGLLVASVVWNVRQHVLLERHRLKVMAEERKEAARIEAEAQQTQARLARKAKDHAANLRVQQLYREIDNLTRINEQLLDPPRPRQISPKADDISRVNGTP
jgi:hypothetical protein